MQPGFYYGCSCWQQTLVRRGKWILSAAAFQESRDIWRNSLSLGKVERRWRRKYMARGTAALESLIKVEEKEEGGRSIFLAAGQVGSAIRVHKKGKETFWVKKNLRYFATFTFEKRMKLNGKSSWITNRSGTYLGIAKLCAGFIRSENMKHFGAVRRKSLWVWIIEYTEILPNTQLRISIWQRKRYDVYLLHETTI